MDSDDTWVSVEDCKAAARNCFYWLKGNGYEAEAVSLLDELQISFKLDAKIKSAYAARKDGDWGYFVDSLFEVTTKEELRIWGIATQHDRRYWSLPPMWKDSLKEEIARKKAELENGQSNDNGGLRQSSPRGEEDGQHQDV